MVTVLIQAFQMFCGIPGGSGIGALVFPIFNPVLLISCFLPIMASVMLISPNMLNSSDSNTKEWARGSQNAFIIYYLIFFLIGLSVLTAACEVTDILPM